jgi:hypothetical protein
MCWYCIPTSNLSPPEEHYGYFGGANSNESGTRCGGDEGPAAGSSKINDIIEGKKQIKTPHTKLGCQRLFMVLPCHAHGNKFMDMEDKYKKIWYLKITKVHIQIHF